MFLQFLLTVIAAALLYANGEGAADWALRFGARLGGERGEAAIRLSGQSIRSVARGVVVTAIVQALIGGIGVAIWIFFGTFQFAILGGLLVFVFGLLTGAGGGRRWGSGGWSSGGGGWSASSGAARPPSGRQRNDSGALSTSSPQGWRSSRPTATTSSSPTSPCW